MIELVLPYPPSVNSYKRVGRIIKTKSGKRYQQRVDSPKTKRFYYEVWMIVKKMQMEPLLGDLHMTLWVSPPDKRKRDIDNTAKTTIDSLQHAGVYIDDYQISKLTIERKEVKIGGEVIVRIEHASQQMLP